MWNTSHNFRIKKVDENRKNYDYRESTSFEVDSHSHAYDRQPITNILCYYGVLEDIIELDSYLSKNFFFMLNGTSSSKLAQKKTSGCTTMGSI